MTIELDLGGDPNLRIGPGGGLWRVIGDALLPLDQMTYFGDLLRLDGNFVQMPTILNLRAESLAAYLEKEPAFLGEQLLVIGRHVPYEADDADAIDFLALDGNGALYVIAVDPEMLVVETVERIQAMEWWVGRNISLSDLHDIFSGYRADASLEEAFFDAFARALPTEITGRTSVMVAGDLHITGEDMITMTTRDRGPEEAFRVVIFNEYYDYTDQDRFVRVLVRRNVTGREQQVYTFAISDSALG